MNISFKTPFFLGALGILLASSVVIAGQILCKSEFTAAAMYLQENVNPTAGNCIKSELWVDGRCTSEGGNEKGDKYACFNSKKKTEYLKSQLCELLSEPQYNTNHVVTKTVYSCGTEIGQPVKDVTDVVNPTTSECGKP